MRSREPSRDNPWTLIGMGVLAVAAAAFGLWCWAQILPGIAAR